MSTPWPEDPTVFHSDEFDPVVELHLPRGPVSSGADARKRRGFKNELGQLTTQIPWTFTADVSVIIEWTVDLRWRYGSDRAVDVDNILKPILDGITGPRGCLLDDTQVNQVSVNWTTWTRTDRQHLKIGITSLDPGGYMPRDLAIVAIVPKVCLPVWRLPDDEPARHLVMDIYESQYRTHQEMLDIGLAWEAAQGVLPAQRPFHPNKLAAFDIFTPDQYRSGEHIRRPPS